MKKDNVTHRGVIQRIDARSLTIITDDACRCDGCAVVALCNKSSEGGGDRETVTIDVPDTSAYSVGQHVEVSASSASTLNAAFWALIVPTVIFVGVLLALNIGRPDMGAMAILWAFVALAGYDGRLYLCRRRLAKKLVWTVRITGR